ncbi:MAG TPA: hypothetical protein VGX48_19890 [Pyrinomonadaceae bacterium]|jgi:DUF4097 and DUF4098 domain-containing protein YvlB|nr:hypothetical protein [Pyrinomonadaceae bacterium]
MENVEMEVVSCGGHIRLGDVGRALHARTRGGNVVIGDVEGAARITTSGGNIEVGCVSGAATLHTSGGHIFLRGGGGSVVAKSAGGHIRLDRVSGVVEVFSSGGNVSVGLDPRGTASGRLTTRGGDISLRVPPDCAVTIRARIRILRDWEANARRCQIVSDFAPETFEQGPWVGGVHALYRLNGGGEVLDLETVNGAIRITRLGGGQPAN